MYNGLAKAHREKWGEQDQFGYKDFIPIFKAEKFDAKAWAELFHKAGARYVIPTAEHHDGFQMYKSELSHWNAAEMGPHRDVLGELKKSCDEKGVTFATSSHRAEHYWFQGVGRSIESDINRSSDGHRTTIPMIHINSDVAICLP